MFVEGMRFRDWSRLTKNVVLTPYDNTWTLLPFSSLSAEPQLYLLRFKPHLEARLDFGSKTYEHTGKPWWGHHQVNPKKYNSPPNTTDSICFNSYHCILSAGDLAYKQSCQLIIPDLKTDFRLIVALYNSSSALFYLRQICFCKRESDNPETDNYYEFAGGKLSNYRYQIVVSKQ